MRRLLALPVLAVTASLFIVAGVIVLGRAVFTRPTPPPIPESPEVDEPSIGDVFEPWRTNCSGRA